MHIKDYYRKLETHDWYYQYSDDSRVLYRGENKERELGNIAHEFGYMELYMAYQQHMFSGKPWGTEKKPKPCWEDYQ